ETREAAVRAQQSGIRPAMPAPRAGDMRSDDDPRTLSDGGHACPQHGDFARNLAAQNVWQRQWEPRDATAQVQIDVVDPTSDDPHQGLSGCGGGDWNFIDLEHRLIAVSMKPDGVHHDVWTCVQLKYKRKTSSVRRGYY